MRKKNIGKIYFVLVVATGIYWILSKYINVYKIALGGVLFELCWLPMLLALFLLPIGLIYKIAEEKLSFKSWSTYAFMLLLLVYVLLFLF